MVHSRNKGLRYEHQVWSYISESSDWDRAGWSTEKKNRSGYDGEDITITTKSGFTISVEAKNQKTMNLAGWVDQAGTQADLTDCPVVVHKRIGRSNVGDHYVTMTVDDFLVLVRRMV